MMIEELKDKIKEALEDSEFDAIAVNGPDNIHYLSGAPLPYLYSFPDRYMGVFWPRRDEPTAIVPMEWQSSFENLSWMSKTRQYTERPGSPGSYAEAVAHLARTTIRKTGKIGVDTARTSQVLYESLEQALEDFELVPCDELLRELRMTKTPGEVSLLEEVAFNTDHGIYGTAHHVLVTSSRSEMSLGEELRVHCMERELDVMGHHSVSQAASGPHAAMFWPLAPKFGFGYEKQLKPGEYVRMEMRASRDGYWSDASRMMTMGEPTEEQTAAYNGLVALRKKALEAMRPGVKCSQVYQAMKSAAYEKGIELIPGMGLGHGVGATTHEPPYLTAADDTELKPGMVVVLDPLIRGPAGEILRSKDTVVVTEEGARMVGWFVDWRMPYVANWTL